MKGEIKTDIWGRGREGKGKHFVFDRYALLFEAFDSGVPPFWSDVLQYVCWEREREREREGEGEGERVCVLRGRGREGEGGREGRRDS
jgi:hypothetical protein